jgi:signal transduction histidine kinase
LTVNLPEGARLSVLAEVGALLASNDDHIAILGRVAAMAVPALCDRCAVYLRTKGGILDRVAIERADASACVCSQLAVPMAVHGRVIGVLQLCRTYGPPYDREDLGFAEELARRVAIYVDHAMLRRDQERLIAELEQTNRDLDQFVYIASHDLRAPLRGIANLAAMIEQDAADQLDAASRTHLELLRGRVRHLEAMIEGVLRYSRAGQIAERPTAIDVGALVRDVVALLDPPPAACVEIDPALPTLHTVRLPLEQVFLNLIGNALKHAGKSDPHVTVGGARHPGVVELYVRDDGPGIAPEDQAQIWDMFRTLGPRRTGDANGLGLSIVRRIVESVGGRVWLESQRGAGSTFRFTWPLDARRTRRPTLATR